LSAAALLFAETPSRILLSAVQGNVAQILNLAREHVVAANGDRTNEGERLKIDVNGERVIDRRVAEVESAWRVVLAELA